MARLRRFENHRFVGTRDDMIVYDCDDPSDFEILQARTEQRELINDKLVQGFGPDTRAEARNRGFRSR